MDGKTTVSCQWPAILRASVRSAKRLEWVNNITQWTVIYSFQGGSEVVMRRTRRPVWCLVMTTGKVVVCSALTSYSRYSGINDVTVDTWSHAEMNTCSASKPQRRSLPLAIGFTWPSYDHRNRKWRQIAYISCISWHTLNLHVNTPPSRPCA